MKNIVHWVWGALFLVLASLTPAEGIKVFVNGEDCGALTSLLIDESTIRLDAERCNPVEKPPEPPPDELVDPACSEEKNLCNYFELPYDKNIFYDKQIKPGYRDVYHFIIPGDVGAAGRNYILDFTLVEFGSAVAVNLGISHVKGRARPTEDDTRYCFSGPLFQGGLVMATDDTYTKCVKQFATDYYFTIENTDSSKTGGYRFSLEHAEY